MFVLTPALARYSRVRWRKECRPHESEMQAEHQFLLIANNKLKFTFKFIQVYRTQLNIHSLQFTISQFTT